MINAKALGIIFSNMHGENVPELVARRTMASIPFAGRYRIIDFALSGMTRAGIKNIGVIARKNYKSLMDHLGNGREWDLSRKRGGLVMFPPDAQKVGESQQGRMNGLLSVMDYLEHQKEELVIIHDCASAFNMDYSDLLAQHIKSEADITAVYAKDELWEDMTHDNTVFSFDGKGFATGVRINEYKKGTHNLCMNVYVIGREYLMNMLHEASVRGVKHLENHVMIDRLNDIKLYGYEFSGYRAHIYNMQSYFKEHLRLLDLGNLAKLFPDERPVYTKVRDEAPVRYGIGADVSDCLVADGCVVGGSVEHCVLFRGVSVAKGAKLKNCVIMQGSIIGEDAVLENVVTDKNVVIGPGEHLRGAANFPVFIAKDSRIF